MPITELKNHVNTITVKTDPAMLAGHILLRNLQDSLDMLQRTVPLNRFRFKRMGNTSTYSYEIKAVDGREWNQEIEILPGQDAKMTFAVTDQWKLGEFSLQRPVRDLVIEITRQYNVDDIDCQWM